MNQYIEYSEEVRAALENKKPVVAIADRIIFLDGGKIVEENTPDKFFENPESERARKFLNIFEFEL